MANTTDNMTPYERQPEKRPQPATTEDALLEAISKAATEQERGRLHTQLIELRETK